MTLGERIVRLQALIDGAGVSVYFKCIEEVHSYLDFSDRYEWIHGAWCCSLSTARTALERLKQEQADAVKQRLTQ